MRGEKYLCKRGVLDSGGLVGAGGGVRESIDQHHLAVVDVETSHVLFLLDVSILSLHQVHNGLLQLLHVTITIGIRNTKVYPPTIRIPADLFESVISLKCRQIGFCFASAFWGSTYGRFEQFSHTS